MTRLPKIKFALLSLLLLCGELQAQSLYESMRPPKWNSYIFVSLKMPSSTLIALAKESQQAGIPMILAGFEGNQTSIGTTRDRIQSINSACCGKRGGTKWQIYPQLFERYKIHEVPTFVLAKGDSESPADFVKISGDIALADALKRIAQQSTQAEMRARAKQIYTKAFINN
ncbi:type-F conjugative transfer system pilin assembly protein TrbC [Chromobacterium haemolyticum]|uniref:Type-F conjugative transfer system pilin assembly protein TrbC n=1 Tax=Chromobacterium fluminis TaxID=3044269 RepID=A0ABX0L7L9_9NEIS|nr:type-F conjugative transfer system pilin assembly protein TrbC [Chromobacterium haemolyticum]NHR07807.1 type-F conjugative transfer system pilin assembly protein TrbC [Chromobacterium haemolyticum]